MLTRFCLLFLSAVCLAQEASQTDGTAAGKGLFRQVSENVFLVGEVRVDTKTREISFPAQVNMVDGPVEYLIVSKIGKLHESLFSTDVEPYHLQTALLLLGLKGSQLPNASAVQSGPLKAENLHKMPEIQGESLTIEIQWKDEKGQEKKADAESWILKSPKNSVMSKGPWTYSGSRFYEDVFLAQEFGSIASIISDPDALINNPRPGHDDDKIWMANPKSMPKLGTAVEIRMKVESSKNPTK